MLILSSLAFLLQPNLDLIAFNKPEVKVSVPSVVKSKDVEELEYTYNIRKKQAKERYERSLLPNSGYQIKSDYEEASKVKDKARVSDTDFKPPLQDKDMKYLPQPTYKLVRYNDPPGSPEINLSRKYKFDRTESSYGLISNDLSFMVYPVVYYYVDRNVSSGDIFFLPLDNKLPDIQRILKANVARRWQKPILETDKSTNVRDTFRTMTPIDFSPDMSKLIAKEKIGNNYDGIWKTNLWVYDFDTKKAVEIVEVREAILHYWQNVKGLDLEEYRWDIYPLGFDKKNPKRIIVNAFAYTGKTPRFLGAWSVDCSGEASKLESLSEKNFNISITGYKLKQDGVRDPEMVKAETKHIKDVSKLTKKEEKKAKKLELKNKKLKYKEELKQINQEFEEKKNSIIKKNKNNVKGLPTS